MLENYMVMAYEEQEIKSVEECSTCGGGIFEGDFFYRFADEIICEDCLELHHRFEAVRGDN